MKPKITFVCPCWPVDRSYGGQLRALHIGRALKKFGEVKLVVVNADPTDPNAIENSAAEFGQVEQVHGATSVRTLQTRLQWALNPRHNNVHGFHATPAESRAFAQAVEDSDIVWFLKLRAANILGQWNWPASVMDIDDLPSTFSEAESRTGTTLKRRLLGRVHTVINRRRERLLTERFSVLSVCSENDRTSLGFKDRLHVIPNGFERPRVEPVRDPKTPPRIGFMGLFSYAPNHTGIKWFAENCWPIIRAHAPDATLRLLGSGSDGPLKPTGPNIEGLGWVKDPAAEMSTWSTMIVPIHTGAGTRMKIVDAYSRKCPIVSTRFGAFGYPVKDGDTMRLADTPHDFAHACLDLIRDPSLGTAIANRAWTEFVKNWTWDAIEPRVWAAAEDCLRRSEPRTPYRK